MSQLYPYIFTSSRRGYRLVAACVGEELHEIGLRMVSDIFELNGWETFYIGANVPFASVIRTVIERKADVLALSATLTYHVSLVRKLIGEIRVNEAEACRKVKILVGGMPFNIDPELWRSVGADGYARDARTAIEAAYGLLGGRESAELGEEA
ncbi:cobalamin B12-binding domain-containing protein [Paenibacillus sanfengchensis]